MWGGVGSPLLTIKQLSHSLGKGQGVPSTCSCKCVSSEMLNDSHSPRSQAGQLEVVAEAGFALATRPSGKEQDSKADGEVRKSTFPSVLLPHRDLYYGIFKKKKNWKKNHELFLCHLPLPDVPSIYKHQCACDMCLQHYLIPLSLPYKPNRDKDITKNLQHRYLRFLQHKHLRSIALLGRAMGQ